MNLSIKIIPSTLFSFILFLFTLFFSSSLWADGSMMINKGPQADLNNAIAIQCPEERRPMCTREYRPVCGSNASGDQKTYANACEACAKTQVSSYIKGQCPTYTLSSQQWLDLFVDHTYEASIPSKSIVMTVYVDKDGTMRGMQGGHKFSSKWQLNDQGEVCVSYKKRLSCRLVMNDQGQYKKYKLDEQGKKVVLVEYQSFAKGNVNHY